VKERTAAILPETKMPGTEGEEGRGDKNLPGGGLHKPAIALGAVAEGLRERIVRLETELAAESGRNSELEQALTQARSAAGRVGEAIEEFAFLDPQLVQDTLPRDRLDGAFSGTEFEELVTDIRDNGQNDAITVRVALNGGGYEVAAGRRRLEACRRLARQVLARVRPLDDHAMLRVQFSENERREDISALERGRWFAEVRTRTNLASKDIAAQFGLDPSTVSLYLRLARFPTEILTRLREPRKLSVLRARRVMETLEGDPSALDRIVNAIDSQDAAVAGGLDPDAQIDLLMRVAEGRTGAGSSTPSRQPLPERRHVVYQGRRIGTLTRNGGQWVFRFATTLREDVVQALANRLGDLVAEVESGLP
jgi:ParB family chromosome partitioning protein